MSSEIVEVRDEFDLLHKFNRGRRLQVKLKGKEADLLDASKAGAPRASGGGHADSPSLKQALRRLCVSQAAEMAAAKRSSKSASVSDTDTIERLYMSVVVEAKVARNSREEAAGARRSQNVRSAASSAASSPLAAVSALRTARMRRTQELMAAVPTKAGKNVDAAATTEKGKQQLLQDVASSPYCKAKTSTKAVFPVSDSRNVDGDFSPKVVGGSASTEKGECSESSKSSLGDCSCSTSISEGSTYSSSSSNCLRPHMSKDAKWAAIQRVIGRQGILGLKSFKLLTKLGCGDIGTVYLAELLDTRYLFALKVMDVEFLIRRKKMPRAQTERDILQMLDHPFLPTLYTHFTTDNLLFLVMEYCPGGDLHVLRQMQPGRRFHEPAARFYVAEVLLALEYLHMLGVIYRDLKPENILVREDGHIMLSDFDLSMRCAVRPARLSSSSFRPKVTHRKASRHCTDSGCVQEPLCLQSSWPQGSCFTPRTLTSTRRPLPQVVVEPTDARSNSFVGTHEYLAPEIIRGDGHGSSVDWWTLGIFLYELLFGQTPFKGCGNEDTLANAVSRPLHFPESPDVSSCAKDLIRGLLVKEPERRLGSVRGAAEIKQHPFFDGLNWALIRCAEPPEVPGAYDCQSPSVDEQDEGKRQSINELF